MKEKRRKSSLLLEWQPYHEEMNKKLKDSLKSESFVKAFIKNRYSLSKLAPKGTFMGEFPTEDAWEMAKSNPILMNIGYDKMFLLSKIYNQQSITFEPTEEVAKLFSSTDFNAPEDAEVNLTILQFHLNELASRVRNFNLKKKPLNKLFFIKLKIFFCFKI